MKKKKIIFVCTGNTCRSPMAEALFRAEIKRRQIKNVEVSSAGLDVAANDTINPHSAQVLRENGLSLENFTSTQLDYKTLFDAFAVICMSERQRQFLFSKCVEYARRDVQVYSFYDFTGYEIPDPYGRPIEYYRVTFDKLQRGMSAIIEKLFPESIFSPVRRPAAKKSGEGAAETPKKRGRKPKAASVGGNEEKPSAPKRGRGRPKKVVSEENGKNPG